MPDGEDASKNGTGPKAQEESLGRNRRVRQNNRYFLDFHCSNLTKGTRTKDEFDFYAVATGGSGGSRTSGNNNSGGKNPSIPKLTATMKVDGTGQKRKWVVKQSQSPNDENVISIRREVEHEVKSEPVAQTEKVVAANETTASVAAATTTASTTLVPTDENRTENSNNKSSSTNTNIINNNNNNINNNNDNRTSSGSSLNNNNNNHDVEHVSKKIAVSCDTKTNSDEAEAKINLITNIHQVEVKKPVIELDLTQLDRWTPEQVANYVSSKGFINEADSFKSQAVDGFSLLLMQRTDFTHGLKMKLGPALKLYNQVCKLKDEYFRQLAKAS